MEYTNINILSLDMPIAGDKELKFIDTITDDNLSTYDGLDEDELEKAIDHILFYIKPTHRDMVEEWIYATLAGEHIKPATIGNKYGLSRQVTSLAMKSAIEMCRLHKEEMLRALGYTV